MGSFLRRAFSDDKKQYLHFETGEDTELPALATRIFEESESDRTYSGQMMNVGDYYKIAENAERIFIGSELPEEYTESESRKSLMGANAKAKANAATAIPELIQIASNPAFEENRKEKHNKNAKYGWYRYDVRFALPVYEENVLVRYNIFHARLLINHAENGRKYLYDILAIKKETSKP